MPPEPENPNSAEDQNAGKKDNGLVLAIKYSHIGFALPAGTIAGWLLGAMLDKWLGMTWMKTAGLIVGIIAGFSEMIRAITQISKESQ